MGYHFYFGNLMKKNVNNVNMPVQLISKFSLFYDKKRKMTKSKKFLL